MTSLAAFPEELLERILAAVVVAPPTPHPRVLWHPRPAADAQTPRRASVLLVSRAFHRIARPLFYHTVVLHNPSQARALLTTLSADPLLPHSVCALVLPAPAMDAAAVLALVAPHLHMLDVTLPTETDAGAALAAALQTACAQQRLNLRTLAVRKSPSTYVSQPAQRAVLAALAATVIASPFLEITTTSFPLSADPTLSPLVAALCTAPSLHTLRTPLPALWAPPLLAISANRALKRICLEGPAQDTSPVKGFVGGKMPLWHAAFDEYALYTAAPLLGTGLFLAAARSHVRLAEVHLSFATHLTLATRLPTSNPARIYNRLHVGLSPSPRSILSSSTPSPGSLCEPTSTSRLRMLSEPNERPTNYLDKTLARVPGPETSDSEVVGCRLLGLEVVGPQVPGFENVRTVQARRRFGSRYAAPQSSASSSP
ncbi:hypothetical protein C8R44DRAFT_989033 [Mycena epipterygia]|nr:hypothetical protein C8R44DRAFT_989033 [Mycena epipterygia]